jgi:hypothetical protein
LMLKFELQVECIKTTTKKKLDKFLENIPCWWSFPLWWSPQPQVFLAFSFFLHNQVHNENYTHVFGHTKWWTFILPCSSHRPQTLGNVLLLQLLDMRNKNPYYK